MAAIYSRGRNKNESDEQALTRVFRAHRGVLATQDWRERKVADEAEYASTVFWGCVPEHRGVAHCLKANPGLLPSDSELQERISDEGRVAAVAAQCAEQLRMVGKCLVHRLAERHVAQERDVGHALQPVSLAEKADQPELLFPMLEMSTNWKYTSLTEV
jgi:hypothetical protein